MIFGGGCDQDENLTDLARLECRRSRFDDMRRLQAEQAFKTEPKSTLYGRERAYKDWKHASRPAADRFALISLIGNDCVYIDRHGP